MIDAHARPFSPQEQKSPARHGMSVSCPKTDLTPISDSVATYLLRTFHSGDPAALFDHLVRQNEPSSILMLVQSGGVPKATEFFFDRLADVSPA
jgi:hypothetical protein